MINTNEQIGNDDNVAANAMAALKLLQDSVPADDLYYLTYLRYAQDCVRIALGGPYRFLINVYFPKTITKEEAMDWLSQLSVDLENYLSPELGRGGGYATKGVVIDPLEEACGHYQLYLAIKDHENLPRMDDYEAKKKLVTAIEEMCKCSSSIEDDGDFPVLRAVEVLPFQKQRENMRVLEDLCLRGIGIQDRVYLTTNNGRA